MNEDKKIFRPRLTEEEVIYLSHLLRNFVDFMYYDDRPDHGWGRLKGYRDLPAERKTMMAMLSGKINRMLHRPRKKRAELLADLMAKDEADGMYD